MHDQHSLLGCILRETKDSNTSKFITNPGKETHNAHVRHVTLSLLADKFDNGNLQSTLHTPSGSKYNPTSGPMLKEPGNKTLPLGTTTNQQYIRSTSSCKEITHMYLQCPMWCHSLNPAFHRYACLHVYSNLKEILAFLLNGNLPINLRWCATHTQKNI